MSKKHFIAIAADLARLMDSSTPLAQGVIIQTAHSLADTFAGFNPNFNRATFLKACHVG